MFRLLSGCYLRSLLCWRLIVCRWQTSCTGGMKKIRHGEACLGGAHEEHRDEGWSRCVKQFSLVKYPAGHATNVAIPAHLATRTETSSIHRLSRAREPPRTKTLSPGAPLMTRLRSACVPLRVSAAQTFQSGRAANVMVRERGTRYPCSQRHCTLRLSCVLPFLPSETPLTY